MAVTSSNPFTVIVADVEAIGAKIVAGLKYFGSELESALKWVDAKIPGAQAAFTGLFTTAETAAETLLPMAEGGLQDVISNAIDSAGSHAANVLSALGVSPSALATKAVLTSADVALVHTAHTVAANAVDVAFAKIIGLTSAAGTALQTANGTPA